MYKDINRWDVSTPTYCPHGTDIDEVNVAVQASGERHERALWLGHLPSWFHALDPSRAEEVAQRIVDDVNRAEGSSGILPVTDEELRHAVGIRPTQTTDPAFGINTPGAALCYLPVQVIL